MTEPASNEKKISNLSNVCAAPNLHMMHACISKLHYRKLVHVRFWEISLAEFVADISMHKKL